MYTLIRASWPISEKVLTDVQMLLREQSPGAERKSNASANDIEECLANPNFRLFLLMRDGSAVGMGSMFFQKNLARWIAEIHDVVVCSSERGNGLGKAVVRRMIREAQEFACVKHVSIKLYLTSRPSRRIANELYVRLGFTMVARAEGSWGTNLYKMMIVP